MVPCKAVLSVRRPLELRFHICMPELREKPIQGKCPGCSVPSREIVSCLDTTSELCGTLSYTDDENRIINGENNLDVMRRKARVLMDTKPLSALCVWGGPVKGWLDREDSRAAGL